jgi:hypothetical protein
MIFIDICAPSIRVRSELFNFTGPAAKDQLAAEAVMVESRRGG